ncbi:MAG: hypothetical protein ACYSR5_09305 [Planctomycetota bacterium]
MTRFIAMLTILLISAISGNAQEKESTSQDAIYQRPFITVGQTKTAVGGYLEGNTNYFSEDGVSEGFSMEMRRFNIFLYSTISKKIRFLSELEFEHGTEEIALETALIDLEINPAFIVRAGVLLPPIGSFNQNHDSPKWEFVERPLVATQIIPSTLSEIGFGFNGRVFGRDYSLTYDFYLVNGLDDGIILNEEGRTFLQSGKNEERFGEDNNGEPMLTGRLALVHHKWGEFGISYYGGAYNSFKLEGEEVDRKRNLSIFAFDFDTNVGKAALRGEFALNRIDVPEDISEIYGKKQWGAYAEVVYPIIRRNILNYENAAVNANLRLERIDYNQGEFSSTQKNIYDEVNAVVFGLSFRPNSNTVYRANYRRHWVRDILGNPTIHIGGFQFGVATYF